MTDALNPKDRVGATKPPLGLVPGTALVHLALALRDGAEKYGAYNWRETAVRSTVYVDAAERHLRAWLDGEDHAPDSGVHHLAHAGACIAILLDAMEGDCLVDDRPPPGTTAELIARLTHEETS